MQKTTNKSIICIAYYCKGICVLLVTLAILRYRQLRAKYNFGPVHNGTNHVPKAVSERDSDPFLIWKPDFTLCERKAISNQAFETRIFETRKKGHFGDPPRKPDSEDMWTQSSFGTWFVRANFGNARWSHAWVNLRSRNKILPRSAQILFVIGTAFAMLVNARSSNHEPNQEADRDPKRLSECDSTVIRSFENTPTVPLRTIQGYDGCTKSMAIAPFWFSMEHR